MACAPGQVLVVSQRRKLFSGKIIAYSGVLFTELLEALRVEHVFSMLLHGYCRRRVAKEHVGNLPEQMQCQPIARGCGIALVDDG